MARMPGTSFAPEEQQRLESARYALLRRLAFAMRHELVVHLQPIAMIMEVVGRRLQADPPDFPKVRDGMEKVNGHARAAVHSSLDVVGWVAPEEEPPVALAAAVNECVELLRTHLSFRGFALQAQTSVACEVPRAAVRQAVSAALLALTDHGASPADVHIDCTESGGAARVTLEVRRTEAAPGFPASPPYRLLTWSDVEAIAQAEGVGCQRQGEAVTLTFALRA